MSEKNALLNLSQSLLDSIVEGNWQAYAELCDESLTCFEPEARGHVVEGLAFHQFYFPDSPTKKKVNTTMASPHVRLMGDVAIVCYTRLTQLFDASGAAVTRAIEETRVWQKKDGQWKHVHFHRSVPT
ncbi:MAG: nuclear transport factor 2 family protein [Pirellulaceae bacterium]|nr:nuclear transport factor 2 family protein [Pirellulaceae bacterium]